MKEETKPVPFKENFIIVTLFVFLFCGLICSAFLEEGNFLNWLILNYSIAILAAFVNYIIWVFQRHNRKRYFSLYGFVTMIVLTYYIMSPAFVSLYPSKYFWFLLAITVGIAILLFVNRVSIARAIHYPQIGGWFMKISIIFGVVIVCLAIFAPSPKREGSITAARALFYLFGLGLLSISPALLISREKTKELEDLPKEGIRK